MASLLFKSQLQEYAQKTCISAPVYEIVKDGQPHAPSFKASVIVNGVRYESPDCFRNRKIAEHAAAQVALQELHKAANGGEVITTNAVYETGLCKNLLQEYAQKMSLPVPSYNYSKEGTGHDFSYTSTVEIAGICYQGGPAKSKKAAEIKAARTALTAIQAQQGFQGNLASPTTTHVDVFDRSWSSQPEFHAGMKRDREAAQPSTSGRRKGKNKKFKASRWKKEVIQDPTDKEKILGEGSTNGPENGQETASAQNTTVINIDDQQKNPEEEMSMDKRVDIKQEQGPCLMDIKQEHGLCSTDSQEHLMAEVAALVDAKPVNQVAGDSLANEVVDSPANQVASDSPSNEVFVDSPANQVAIDPPSNLVVDPPANQVGVHSSANQVAVDPSENGVVDPPANQVDLDSPENQVSVDSPANQVAVDFQGNTEESNQEENVIECGDIVVNSQGNYENDGQKKNESQRGDMVSVPQEVDEQGKRVTTEDTDKCSVEKVENNQGTTQLLLMDPLQIEKETTQQELLDPLMYHENCN